MIKLDIGYVVHKLNQYLSSPKLPRLQAAYKVLKYLKNNPRKGLFFFAQSTLHLKSYCDADWAGCLETRRSIFGFCVFLGDSLISWKCKMQQVVARSSAESEYRAMIVVTSELMWLIELSQDLGFHHKQSTSLYCDCKVDLYIVGNLIFHKRTKYIEVDCHFIKEKIQTGTIRTIHVPTKHQLADLFTKPLGKVQFFKHLYQMGILNIYAPS